MIKKIAIVGPESTGKSTLSKQLAAYFNCQWVPEYAREFLQNLGRPYIENDLLIIAGGQIALEKRQKALTDKLLICDTNLIVIKIWSEFKYGKCDPKILCLLEDYDYDLTFLCDIDLAWEPDPLREHPDSRKELFELYLKELKERKINFLIINGNDKQRCERAINAITDLDKN
jgi:NadR type nicotinamide-nucleotide adenylyltransferase